MSDRILREAEVQAKTGLSRSTRWRLEKLGAFPKRRQISSQAVGWSLVDIDVWVADPAGWRDQHGTAA